MKCVGYDEDNYPYGKRVSGNSEKKLYQYKDQGVAQCFGPLVKERHIYTCVSEGDHSGMQ